MTYHLHIFVTSKLNLSCWTLLNNFISFSNTLVIANSLMLRWQAISLPTRMTRYQSLARPVGVRDLCVVSIYRRKKEKVIFFSVFCFTLPSLCRLLSVLIIELWMELQWLDFVTSGSYWLKNQSCSCYIWDDVGFQHTWNNSLSPRSRPPHQHVFFNICRNGDEGSLMYSSQGELAIFMIIYIKE